MKRASVGAKACGQGKGAWTQAVGRVDTLATEERSTGPSSRGERVPALWRGGWTGTDVEAGPPAVHPGPRRPRNTLSRRRRRVLQEGGPPGAPPGTWEGAHVSPPTRSPPSYPAGSRGGRRERCGCDRVCALNPTSCDPTLGRGTLPAHQARNSSGCGTVDRGGCGADREEPDPCGRRSGEVKVGKDPPEGPSPPKSGVFLSDETPYLLHDPTTEAPQLPHSALHPSGTPNTTF